MQGMRQSHSQSPTTNLTPKQNEFSLTIIDDSDLVQRLSRELKSVFEVAKQAWPAFKRDPVNISLRLLGDLLRRVKQSFARPHALRALLTAILIVCLSLLSLLSLDRARPILTRSLNLDD